ncbi:MAG: recombinase family protein [Muribaculum sp.]|nr:recombinase family protein [Muribaculum sp.]
MKGNGTKITALYCRLSQDDGNVGDSMSIQSQKAILEKFAREMGKAAYSFYVDDGYSGTNFQRPSFQKMIADIEDGKIDTVITKDLSRLGRNYLESGAYIEVFFPQHHVRYIAINDGVDSEQNGGLDITPFKNILNEFYSRDISKKVKSGKHIRALEGKFMGTTAPFGYRKDPQDKNHLIVDEMTAPTVRLIYSLALEGYGTNRIGKVLYERKIPKPSYYKQEFFSQHNPGSEDYWYDWKQEVVTRIIRNPVYKGGMYVHGTSKPTFKCKGRGYIRRADREVLEDVHEAVVTKEVWQTANDIIDRHTKVKPCTSGYENIFRGLLKCPDCGQTLLIHTDNRNPDRDLLDKTYYQCTTYRKKGANFCTAHRISAGDIENAVKADIDRHAEKAMKNKEKFINNVLRGMNESSVARSEKTKAEIDRLKSRNAELDKMYIRLYEDYSGGKLSEKKFTMMSAHYEQEQETNEERLTELEKQYQAKSAATANAEQFTESLAQCAGMKKLTASVLNTLIEKIEVHNPVMVNGVKEQKLTIYYKFVGQID